MTRALRRALPPLALHAGGPPLRVHALASGWVQVKRRHAAGPPPGGHGLRFAVILADPRFAAAMPVLSRALEHPQGLFLVDAGSDPRYDDPERWAGDRVSGALIRSFFRLDRRPEEALPRRLEATGLDPGAVSAVVLTHQHVDHTGGVPAPGEATLVTARAEDEAALRIGALHDRWRRPHQRVRWVDEEGVEGLDPLGRALPLTEDGRLLAVHTPGHTPGSLTVVLRADEGELLFLGDLASSVEGLAPGADAAGIRADLPRVRALHAALRAREAIVLPSHDPEAPARLERGF